MKDHSEIQQYHTGEHSEKLSKLSNTAILQWRTFREIEQTVRYSNAALENILRNWANCRIQQWEHSEKLSKLSNTAILQWRTFTEIEQTVRYSNATLENIQMVSANCQIQQCCTGENSEKFSKLSDTAMLHWRAVTEIQQTVKYSNATQNSQRNSANCQIQQCYIGEQSQKFSELLDFCSVRPILKYTEKEEKRQWLNEWMNKLYSRQQRRCEVCLHPAVTPKGKPLKLQVNLHYTEYMVKQTKCEWIRMPGKKLSTEQFT